MAFDAVNLNSYLISVSTIEHRLSGGFTGELHTTDDAGGPTCFLHRRMSEQEYTYEPVFQNALLTARNHLFDKWNSLALDFIIVWIVHGTQGD